MTTPTFEAIVADYRRMGYSQEEAFRRAVDQSRGKPESSPDPDASVQPAPAEDADDRAEREERARKLAAPCRLECRADDFVRALRLLSAAQKRGRVFTLTFTEGELTLTRGVTSASVPASGDWFGTVSAPVHLIRDVLKRSAALRETVVIHAHNGRLAVDAYWTTCSRTA